MKYILLLTILLTSCKLPIRQGDILMSDTDFVEFDRQYSPDSSMMILNYGLDQGAFGYGSAGKAVLNLTDTTKDLTKFNIKGGLMRVQWINQDTISARKDILPYIRSDKPYKIQNQRINGITISIAPYDYIEPNFERLVEFREKSPDGTYEIIAYRYIKNSDDLKFIHVSVIKSGHEIPRYGNFLIADMQSDYVFDGEWKSDNTLTFFSNELYTDMVQYYLVKNRPKIEHEIVVDEKRFGNKYRWINMENRNYK